MWIVTSHTHRSDADGPLDWEFAMRTEHCLIRWDS